MPITLRSVDFSNNMLTLTFNPFSNEALELIYNYFSEEEYIEYDPVYFFENFNEMSFKDIEDNYFSDLKDTMPNYHTDGEEAIHKAIEELMANKTTILGTTSNGMVFITF
jgi:hypothetical protein